MAKTVLFVAAALLACAVADAKKPRPQCDPRDPPRAAGEGVPRAAALAFVDDEPMSLRVLESQDRSHGLDDVKLRSADIRAPEIGRVGREGGAVSEATPVVEYRGDAAPLSGAMEERVAKQMRKNLASIDACTQAAMARHPTVNGTVELRVTVTEKKVTAIHVAADEVKDIELDACLVKAGRSWRFDLRAAAFTWPVTLSPTASR